MTTNAQIGYGRLLKIRDDAQSPPAFVTAGEIMNVGGPNIAADAVDATHNESPNGFREFIPGLADAGEVTGELNYVPGSAGVALILSKLRQVAHIQVVEPGGGSPEPTMESDAILTAFTVTASTPEKMTAAITFKLTGTPVMTGVTFGGQ